MISLIPFSQRSDWYFCVLMAGRLVGDDYVREKRRLVWNNAGQEARSSCAKSLAIPCPKRNCLPVCRFYLMLSHKQPQQTQPEFRLTPHIFDGSGKTTVERSSFLKRSSWLKCTLLASMYAIRESDVPMAGWRSSSSMVAQCVMSPSSSAVW